MTIDQNQMFRSLDGRFGLIIPVSCIARIRKRCIAARRFETGGILVGHYDVERRRAVVTAASGPPTDSVAGPMSFRRGVRGIDRWLEYLWRRGHGFYLGEWHFHPQAPVLPSVQDIQEMLRIARTPSYVCPEPVLVVLGGDPYDCLVASALVIIHRGERITLVQCVDEDPAP